MNFYELHKLLFLKLHTTNAAVSISILHFCAVWWWLPSL